MTTRKRTPTLEVVTLARPPAQLASGDTVLGRFVIVEHYGAGPLGHTYRAHDPTGAQVAVKLVARELVPTPAERQALIGEVHKLVGKSLPNAATPIDAVVDGSLAFVVSPWVPGKSLRRVLGAYRDAGRAMPTDEARGVLEGVVGALRQLHAICPHGALYPESIQIARDGHVVLTDAGIASGAPRARLIEHFERYPDVMAYLAPEIRGGRRSTAGADLYSLGALASELLTGDPGAAAAGIAGAMLATMGREVAEALAGMVGLKPSQRAAALPALIKALSSTVEAASVPASAALPRRRQPTDVVPVSETPRSRRGRDG